MSHLYFVQITDERFDENIKELLETRVARLRELLTIDNVEVKISEIEEITFPTYTEYRKDGSVAYVSQEHKQCRCRFDVIKRNRKMSWNDIFKIVNSVKAVPYKFI